MSFFHLITDPASVIRAVGLVGVFAIIFAGSGLFFGFFFPGDSLLFTAGFLASQGYLPTGWLFTGVFVAAVLGDNFGYAFGRRAGPSLFTRGDSIFFNKKYPEQAGRFYKKYGTRTIIFSRFVPVVRTFAPIVAGIANMDYRTFFIYNVIGGALWTFILTGAGFLLGNSIPGADRYISPIIAAIILVSCIPPAFHFFRERKEQEKSKNERPDDMV